MCNVKLYSDDENIMELLENALKDLQKSEIKIHSQYKINIFVVNSFPEKILPDTKYILCCKNEELENFHKGQLDFFYDLWSGNLTPVFIKFQLRKILRNIKSEFEAAHDFLTGLGNRRLLSEYLPKIKNEKNVTAIYFDLDNFKNFNDIHGHCEGDRVLAETADMLRKEFNDDFIVRMGGDEFLVIIAGIISDEKVREKTLSFIKKSAEKNIPVSAGFSQKLNGEKKSLEKLIHESDRALFSAKKTTHLSHFNEKDMPLFKKSYKF